MRATIHAAPISGGTYASPAPKTQRVPSYTSSKTRFPETYKELYKWIKEEIHKDHLPSRYDYGIPKRSRSKERRVDCYQTRLVQLDKQFLAFASAWTHAYGEIRFCTYGTKNYGKLAKFIKFLGAFLRGGIVHVKNACHYWRALALGDKDKAQCPLPCLARQSTTSPEGLFVASTLARAISLPTDHLQASAVQEAIDRWTGLYEKLEDGLEEKLEEYTYQLLSSLASNSTESASALAPLVAPKACLETPSSKGGCIKAIRELHERAQRCMFDVANPSPIEPSLGLARGVRGRGMHRLNLEHLARIDRGSRRKLQATTPLAAFQTARFYASRMAPACQEVDPITLLPDRLRRRTVKPIAIEELGQKVRVASLHPAALAHFSRGMAQRTMPLLKRCRVFRKVLYGDTVRVRGVRFARLYSADLTAASDYISHSIGQAVLRGIARALGVKGVTEKALMACLGPMEVLDPRLGRIVPTRSGAHMGLGTTWTVLCILNHWAASNAGPPSSFAICGDDLVAAWTEHQVAIYNESIRRLGLVSNSSKSYYGERGVFCERLMVPEKPGSFVSISMPRLAEITFARGSPDGETREVLAKYLKGSLLKPTRRTIETALAQSRGSRVEAPVASGGYGGRPNEVTAACLLQQYLTRGPLRDHSTPPEVSQLVQRLSPTASRTPRKGAVRLDEAVISSRCCLREAQVGKGIVPPIHKANMKIRDYKCKGRIQAGRKALEQANVLLRQSGNNLPPSAPQMGNAPRLPKAGSVFGGTGSSRSLPIPSAPQKGNAPRLPKAGSVFGKRKVIIDYFDGLLKHSPYVTWKVKARCRRNLHSLLFSNRASMAYLLEEVTRSKPSSFTTEQELRAVLIELDLYTRPTSQNGAQGSCRWEKSASPKG
uniref:RNA-dependent RNA polymerase n=1 Tax=Rhizopus microsporus narnavirus 2 TaxID=3156533 RepID=A0AAT9H812_9VIRU